MVSSGGLSWKHLNQPATTKHMKMAHIITAIFSLLLVSLGFAADDKKTTTYAVGMTGVT